MVKIGIWNTIVILVLAAAFLAVLWLAIRKLLKSKISDQEKIVWFLLLIIFNIITAFVFIIYHDYFLTSTKRAS